MSSDALLIALRYSALNEGNKGQRGPLINLRDLNVWENNSGGNGMWVTVSNYQVFLDNLSPTAALWFLIDKGEPDKDTPALLRTLMACGADARQVGVLRGETPLVLILFVHYKDDEDDELLLLDVCRVRASTWWCEYRRARRASTPVVCWPT